MRWAFNLKVHLLQYNNKNDKCNMNIKYNLIFLYSYLSKVKNIYVYIFLCLGKLHVSVTF